MAVGPFTTTFGRSPPNRPQRLKSPTCRPSSNVRRCQMKAVSAMKKRSRGGKWPVRTIALRCAFFLLAVPNNARADNLVPLNGGLFDGLRIVAPNRPEGFQSGEFIPGYEHPSPPPQEQISVITALLKQVYANDERAFNSYLAPGAIYNGGELDWHGKDSTSPDVPLTVSSLLPLATVCVGADFWKLSDEARISWICAGRLAYVSFVSFDHSRVTAIKTRALPTLTFGGPK